MQSTCSDKKIKNFLQNSWNGKGGTATCIHAILVKRVNTKGLGMLDIFVMFVMFAIFVPYERTKGGVTAPPRCP